MRLGLVGYGAGGRRFRAPFIAAAEGVELAGVGARAPATIARVTADLPGTPVFPSLTAMIAGGEVDAVAITTPPCARGALVLEAAEGPTDAGFTLTLRHASGMHSHLEASKLNRLAAKEYRA